jgi:outer membrane protein insertion porin family
MTGRTLLILLLAVIALSAQTPVRTRTPTVAPITSITVTGNRILPTEAILTASGLKINQDGGSAFFDAARDRLLATGYFDLVGYTFKIQDLGFTVAFSVTEMQQMYPIRVEGLPATLPEVTAILRAKDPLFTKLLPGTKPVIDRAAKAIEQSLAGSSPNLSVRAKVITTGPDSFEIQFAPAGGLPVIADMSFEGSKLLTNSELRAATLEGVIGQVYSDADVRALLDRLVRPLYEKHGYMRVAFPKITSSPAAEVKGLDVKVTIIDGPQFKPGSITVRGPMASESKRILRIAKLPEMDYINFDEVLLAVPRIRDTLRGEGYLDAEVSADRSIDDAGTTVDAWFEVNPGTVYTFGHLQILGLGLDGEAAIRKMWGVKVGDPFPGGYPDHFVQTVTADGLFDNLGAITATPSVNHENHTVDVTLHFTGAAAPSRQRSRPQF